MSVDHFDRQQFEAALPCLKGTRSPLWGYTGLISGEHQYYLPVKPGVIIVIRSSVGADGCSADSGADSIRCWLADPTGKPLGSKYGRWVTRVSGWERRLTDVLRALWHFGIRLINCPKCSQQMKAFKTASGPNEGHWYMKCTECNWWDSWLNEGDKRSAIARKGGVARAASMTQQTRSDIARAAVNVRWARLKDDGGTAG